MKKTILFITLGLLLNACTKDKEQYYNDLGKGKLQLSWELKNNTTPIGIEQSFETIKNYNVKFSALKFYLSDIYAIKEDNSKIYVKDVYLGDLNTSDKQIISNYLPQGKYKGFGIAFGLPKQLNGKGAVKTPAEYPEKNPLHPNKEMFWTWSEGYQFVKLEGQLDTAQNNNFNTSFIYHLATNEMYRTVFIAKPFEITAQNTSQVLFTLDLATLFGNNLTVNVPNNPINQSGVTDLANANNFMDTFVKSFK